MLTVPLRAVPAQKVRTVLNNVVVDLTIRQLRYGMFIDVSVEGALVIGAVMCQHRNRIIRSAYLNTSAGFAGDLVFFDTQGSDDPQVSGLGTRWLLIYLSQAELTAMGLSA